MDFDENIAVELGVECAIILKNIEFWVKTNRANGEERHYHDGKWWTYNTAGSYAKLFPWWSERNVYRFLKKLEEAGYIQSGNFNKFKYDRTKWYTSETEKSLIKPIRQKRQMDSPKQVNGFAKLANGIVNSGGPIPDINTNINSDVNTDISYSEQVAESEKDSSNWTGIVIYFYSKVSPSTPPQARFRKEVKPAAIHLLSLHSEDLIKQKIDALATNHQERKFITRFEVFCNKFDTLLSFSKTSIPVTYIDAKPKRVESSEPEPDF